MPVQGKGKIHGFLPDRSIGVLEEKVPEGPKMVIANNGISEKAESYYERVGSGSASDIPKSSGHVLGGKPKKRDSRYYASSLDSASASDTPKSSGQVLGGKPRNTEAPVPSSPRIDTIAKHGPDAGDYKQADLAERKPKQEMSKLSFRNDKLVSPQRIEIANDVDDVDQVDDNGDTTSDNSTAPSKKEEKKSWFQACWESILAQRI
jgi:hypothetical protein